MTVRVARISALPWASPPASAAGLVAPVWLAEATVSGMPLRTAVSITPQSSWLRRRGETMAQMTWAKGRLRKASPEPSPPSDMSYMATARSTFSGTMKLVTMCLVVPDMQA